MNDKQNESIKKREMNWNKYLYTAIFCYANITYGIASTSVASALTDLKYILNTSTALTSHYFTLYAIGYLFGSLCGFLTKLINRQLMLILMLILISTAISITPLFSNLIIFYISAFVNGMGSGTLDCTQNVQTIETYTHKSGPILQLIQFSFGLGTIIGPLIVKPFVSGEPDESGNDIFSSNKSTILNSSTTIQSVIINVITADDRRSSLMKPFFIVGFLFILSAFMMTFMFVFRRYKNENQNMEIDFIDELSTPVNNCEQNIRTKLFDQMDSPNKLIVFLGAFCIASYSSIELACFQFIPSFAQYIKLRLSASASASLLSAMATSYTIARGLSIFIAIKVKPQHMLITHFGILSISCIILLLSENSLTLLWTGNILIGIGFSAMWSALFAYIEQYLVINDTIGSIFIFSVGAVSAVLPFIIGPALSSFPIVLVYFCIISLLLSITTFIIIHVIILRFQKHSKYYSYNTQRVSIGSVNAVITYLSIKRLSFANKEKHNKETNNVGKY